MTDTETRRTATRAIVRSALLQMSADFDCTAFDAIDVASDGHGYPEEAIVAARTFLGLMLADGRATRALLAARAWIAADRALAAFLPND